MSDALCTLLQLLPLSTTFRYTHSDSFLVMTTPSRMFVHVCEGHVLSCSARARERQGKGAPNLAYVSYCSFVCVNMHASQQQILVLTCVTCNEDVIGGDDEQMSGDVAFAQTCGHRADGHVSQGLCVESNVKSRSHRFSLQGGF